MPAGATAASQARGVRPMPIKIVSVSRGGGSKGAQLLADEYSAKLGRYTSVTHVRIKSNPHKSRDPEKQRHSETLQVRQRLHR